MKGSMTAPDVKISTAIPDPKISMSIRREGNTQPDPSERLMDK